MLTLSYKKIIKEYNTNGEQLYKYYLKKNLNNF